MFKRKSKLLFFWFLIIMILSGCNSREDVVHTSKEKIIQLVTEAIDEPVKFVSQSGEEKDDLIIYIFNLMERNITFSVKSYISAPTLDGTPIGNYKEKITIEYESAIMFDSNYIKERENISKKYNIYEQLEGNEYHYWYNTEINDYRDLSNLTNYYLELDKLYNFKEKQPDKISHENSGIICSDTLGSIEGINFSFTKKDKLKYDRVFKDIEERYVGHLKWFNKEDSTIPNNIWNKYDAAL